MSNRVQGPKVWQACHQPAGTPFCSKRSSAPIVCVGAPSIRALQQFQHKHTHLFEAFIRAGKRILAPRKWGPGNPPATVGASQLPHGDPRVAGGLP